MGHTVTSQRRLILDLVAELERYGRALRHEDREVLHDVVRMPLRHIGSISYANSMHVWAFFLLSALVEQEKRLAHRRLPERERHRPLAENT